MGGGKTNEFIRMCKRLTKFADSKKYVMRIVKSPIDDRIVEALKDIFDGDPTKTIQSRDGLIIDEGVYPVLNSGQLKGLLFEARKEAERRFGKPNVVIAVSETQFLDSGILQFISSLDNHTYFLWEGLDKSFRGEPFMFSDYRATIFDLIEVSDEVSELLAICEDPDCTRRNVNYTQRFSEDGNPSHYSEELIVVGELDYQARCRDHHIIPGKKEAGVIKLAVQTNGEKGIPLSKLYELGDMSGISEQKTEDLINCFLRERQFSIENDFVYYIGIGNNY